LKKRIVFIVGPTAAGKTELSIKLAKEINGEIISADSMQAYKGMDIMSQAPSGAEQKKVKHHLITFLSAKKEYSAASFCGMAEKIIRDILKRGKTPVVTGGSGLYVKALIDGIFPSKGKNPALRKKLRLEVSEKGALSLHKKLEKIDPISARKIHPNDLKRVIRALEIHELEKKTKSDLKKETMGIKEKYDIDMFGLTAGREKLYRRINGRVDSMFRAGLVREVKKLTKSKMSVTSRQALGFKQVSGYLSGDYSLEKAKETLKRDTRRLAKRQLTWFRPDRRITWLDLSRVGKARAVRIMVNTIKGRA